MFLTKVVLLATALILATAQESSDIFAEADRYLADFISTVRTALDESAKNFDLYEERVLYVTIEVVKNAVADLAAMSNLFEQAVDQMKNDAKQDDLRLVEECISPNMEEMETMPISVGELINRCVLDLEESAVEEIKSARNEAEDFLTVADQLKADVEGCRVANEDEECAARVVIEIFLQTLEVPLSIQKLSTRAEATLINYTNVTPSCVTDRIMNVGVVTDRIITTIRTCIDGALNPTN